MSSKSVNSSYKTLIGLLLLASSTGTVLAESNLSPEQRLSRLENLLSNQVLMEQSQRMEQVQQELSSLRELMEGLEHQLGMIKQRQRNLYQDMDRRLHDVEIKGGGSGSSSPSNVSIVPMAIKSPTSPVPPPNVATAVTPSVGSAVAKPVSGDKNGKQAYSSAFNSLKQGKYQQSIVAFKAFQQSYPDSVYGANAQYWLGEAYSVTRDYKTALTEFQKVASKFPGSNKVEGAMLKVGFTFYEMQDWESAKASLNTVIKKYPGSTVARKAKERLQRIKREGH